MDLWPAVSGRKEQDFGVWSLAGASRDGPLLPGEAKEGSGQACSLFFHCAHQGPGERAGTRHVQQLPQPSSPLPSTAASKKKKRKKNRQASRVQQRLPATLQQNAWMLSCIIGVARARPSRALRRGGQTLAPLLYDRYLRHPRTAPAGETCTGEREFHRAVAETLIAWPLRNSMHRQRRRSSILSLLFP